MQAPKKKRIIPQELAILEHLANAKGRTLDLNVFDIIAPEWHIISLGGGIQSSTMLLLAIHGLITPKPMCAIFSDPQWERPATYEHIKWLSEIGAENGIPVYTITWGNIRDDMLNQEFGDSFGIPFYVKSPTKNRYVQLKRQCTADYKIRPIAEMVKKLVPVSHKRPACQWIGISIDESQRMKPSRVKYMHHRYPLIEMRWGRDTCVEWLKEQGYPIPVRSSCIGCPFHSNDGWAELNEDELADAIDFDNKIRNRRTFSKVPTEKRIQRIKDSYPQAENLFEIPGSREAGKVLYQDISMPATGAAVFSEENLEDLRQQEIEALRKEPGYDPETNTYIDDDGEEYNAAQVEPKKIEVDNRLWLHRSGKPLSEKPFLKHSESQLDFLTEAEECEGGCFL